MRYGSVVASLLVACALVAIGRPGAAAAPLIVPDVAEPAPIRIVDSSTNVLYQGEFADFIDIVRPGVSRPASGQRSLTAAIRE